MLCINKCLSIKICVLLTWLQSSWNFFKHIFEMGVNRKSDFSLDWKFCLDWSNIISGRNWLFRWDFLFSSGNFYPSANYDYNLDWNKKCCRKTCNHNFRPLKLFPTWFSRISTVFYGNFSLWHIWQILHWVLVILWELNQIFGVSSIKLFLKIVALEKLWVTSKTNSWQQSINLHVNWHGNDVICIKKFY